jgi:uncharacterized membrane protein
MGSLTKRRVLSGLTAFLLTLFIYNTVLRPLLHPLVALPRLPGGLPLSTLVLMLFSLFHAWYAFGGWHTLVFFVLTTTISWGYEQLGVETGLIYGAYQYTDRLGAKVGHVPVLIPIAWFMMIYPSYIIANLMADGQPTGSRGGLGRVVWLSLISAMVMTAWDLVIDPILSSPPMQAWIWEASGPYFGVPLQNFAGWMLTTFTIYLLYRLFEHRVQIRPVGSMTGAIAAMPLLAYGAMMIANIIPGDPEALQVIAPFAMGLPLAVAAGRLWKQLY